MSTGLATTFRVLARSPNEAAVRVLISALDSPDERIQEEALKATLKRRNLAGQREILRRLHDVDETSKEIIREHHSRMARALRDAVLGTDRQMCSNACQAAVWFREYDLVATLLTVAEDRTRPHADMAADTVLQLARQLYEALAGPRDRSDRRDPQLIRRHVIASLEASVRRFPQHKRREVIEAFLLLVGRDNATLKQILQDPHHGAFLSLVEVLAGSDQAGAVRLLLSFLDDVHAPSAALSVIANRSDAEFVQHLLRKIGREPSAAVGQNLRRIESVAWLGAGGKFLDQLDDAAQHGAVRLIMRSAIPRLQAFSTIEYLLRYGKPGGRRAAAEALEQFQGADANALAMRALDDPDPQVQASIVVQMRSRGIPGVLPRLVEMVDSPHRVVREAVQESLAEFTFARFIGAFDVLDDEVRRSTGLLVRKIDPRTMPLLKAELTAKARTRRLRGLAVARAIDAVESLESTVVGLLDDEDHLIRLEAIGALAECTTEASLRALERALEDQNATVREAARRGLAARVQFPRWPGDLLHPQGEHVELPERVDP